MMKMGILLQKLFRNIKADLKSTGINLCILTVSFITLVVSTVLMINIAKVLSGMSKNLGLTIYLKENTSTEDGTRIANAIRKIHGTTEVKFISSENFKKKFLNKNNLGLDSTDSIPSSVFPSIIEVSVSPDFAVSPSLLSMIQKLKKLGTIEDIEFNENWIKNSARIFKIAWVILLVFTAMMVFSSLIVQSNMIQLGFSKKKKEIEVMRLCGATNSFIETPVIIEGFFIATISSILSIFLTYILFSLVKNWFLSNVGQISNFEPAFVPLPLTLLIIIIGGLIGMSGAYIASRKSLGV